MQPTEKQIEGKKTAIKAEKAKLLAILKDMDPARLEAADSLIESCAFMAASLQQLQWHMNEHGLTSEYQNGPNQWGTKRSPEADLHAVMLPQYRATVRLLIDLLPGGAKGAAVEEVDELMEFVNGDTTKVA